jgi:3-hydroxyacyl-[acyl-carrier-protein] dehydratase
VPVKDLILDFSAFDPERVIADLDAIRRYNPQRYEMEQLTAVCYEDEVDHICVGYRDLTDDEFWVRGHMPDVPLMPGVVMCEAAAQLASYFTQKYDLLGAEMIGFGGLEEVRFRDVVRPGDRLIIMAKLLKVRRGAMIVCRFQCFVGESLVCEGKIKGIPLPADLLSQREPVAEHKSGK